MNLGRSLCRPGGQFNRTTASNAKPVGVFGLMVSAVFLRATDADDLIEQYVARLTLPGFVDDGKRHAAMRLTDVAGA